MDTTGEIAGALLDNVVVTANRIELKEFNGDGPRRVLGARTFTGTVRGLTISGTVEIDWKTGTTNGRVIGWRIAPI